MIRALAGRLMLWAMRRYFLGREVVVTRAVEPLGPPARHRPGKVTAWDGHKVTIEVPNRLLGAIGRVDTITGHFSKLRKRQSPKHGTWWEFEE